MYEQSVLSRLISQGTKVQVKKDEVRQAILSAAQVLFSRKGYHHATLRDIAKAASISLSTIYVYFKSKYEIIFAVYDPWMIRRVERLERDANAIDDPRKRLPVIVLGLLREIPAAKGGFARNIMQALATRDPQDDYNPAMINWIETKFTSLLSGCLPQERQWLLEDGHFVHLLVMAFDGFVINQGLNSRARFRPESARIICDLLLGSAAPSHNVAHMKSLGVERKDSRPYTVRKLKARSDRHA